MTAYERFIEKVDKNGPIPPHCPELGKCWTWNGARRPKGYGTFMFNGKVGSVHRFAYLHLIGEIPKGNDVMHKCDNPTCVNPNHLTTGTRKQNMEDCSRKCRNKGEKRSKIKNETILEIRRIFDSKQMRVFEIAKHFGFTRSFVNHVVHRYRWTHI